MAKLSESGERLVAEIGARHGFGSDAVTQMLIALQNGGGSQAQFSHPEFGGMGQWSQGGMTMVGDMFNHGLKARVDALCFDLSGSVQAGSVFAQAPMQSSQSQSQGGFQSGGMPGGSSLFVPQETGWPAGLGHPASQGAQNDMRYAYFPDKARLAISVAGKVTIYDTGDHRISGFGQAQSGERSLSFTSQHGLVHVADLAVVDMEHHVVQPVVADAYGGAAMPGRVGAGSVLQGADNDGTAETKDAGPSAMAHAGGAMPGTQSPKDGDEQIFSRLERLADFHSRGILSDDEFAAKKTELLTRL